MIVDIETAFKTVFGRSPTTAERRRLAYLSASWAVDGNEALIAVLFVLELGAGFREYPARCAESVRRAVRTDRNVLDLRNHARSSPDFTMICSAMNKRRGASLARTSS